MCQLSTLQCKVKRFTYHYIRGDDQLPIVFTHNSCSCNEYMAFHFRHMTTGTDRVDNEVFPFSLESDSTILYNFLNQAVLGLHSTMSKALIQPITMFSIVKTYSGRLRKKYEKAYKNIKEGLVVTPRIFVNRCFIKDDKYHVKDFNNVVEYKMPRAIQYQSGESVLLKGVHIIPIEKQFYQLLDVHGLRIFTKGLNNVQIGQLFVDSDVTIGSCVYIENDYSSFDASVCVEMLKLYTDFVLQYVPSRYRSKLRWYMSMGYFPRGYTTNGHKYKVTGTVTSGDIDTSFKGNFVNYIVSTVVMAYSGIPEKGYKLILNGDDSVVFLDKKYLSYYQPIFDRFGLNAKVVIKQDLHEVEFCQSKLFQCSSGNYLVRDLKRTFTRFGWSVRNQGKRKKSRDYIKTVVMGEMALNFKVPYLYNQLRYIYHQINGDFNKQLIDDRRYHGLFEGNWNYDVVFKDNVDDVKKFHFFDNYYVPKRMIQIPDLDLDESKYYRSISVSGFPGY